MATAQDAIQHYFAVGDVVNIPMVVTAVGGTATQPTVTGNTKYVGFDGNADAITVDAKQVIKDE